MVVICWTVLIQKMKQLQLNFSLPPLQQIQDWWGDITNSSHPVLTPQLTRLAVKAANWGAEQETEACCAQVSQCHFLSSEDARRVANYLHDLRKPFRNGDSVSKLSPATQSILDAFDSADTYAFFTHRADCLAAALKVLAERVRNAPDIKQDILDISVELENLHTDSFV